MAEIKEKFLVDGEGHRIGVFLDINEYEKIIDELDELAAIRAFDSAMESDDESVDAEQAFKEIESRKQQ